MKNRASIKDAVKLIRRAVKEDWKREVSYMRYGDGETWHAMVTLRKTLLFRNGYINIDSHIIVNFRKAQRNWVVSLAVTNFNGGKEWRGLWNANYALDQMASACQRQTERDAQREAVAA